MVGSGDDALNGDKWPGDFQRLAVRGGTEHNSLPREYWRRSGQNEVDLREKERGIYYKFHLHLIWMMWSGKCKKQQTE